MDLTERTGKELIRQARRLLRSQERLPGAMALMKIKELGEDLETARGRIREMSSALGRIAVALGSPYDSTSFHIEGVATSIRESDQAQRLEVSVEVRSATTLRAVRSILGIAENESIIEKVKEVVENAAKWRVCVGSRESSESAASYADLDKGLMKIRKALYLLPDASPEDVVGKVQHCLASIDRLVKSDSELVDEVKEAKGLYVEMKKALDIDPEEEGVSVAKYLMRELTNLRQKPDKLATIAKIIEAAEGRPQAVTGDDRLTVVEKMMAGEMAEIYRLACGGTDNG